MQRRGLPSWHTNTDGSLTVYTYTPQTGGRVIRHSQRIPAGTPISDVPWQYKSQVRSARAEGWDRSPEYQTALWDMRKVIRYISILLGLCVPVLLLILGHHGTH